MVGEFVVGLSMTNCIGDRGRHFMTTTGEAGIARDISVTGNTFRGSILGAIAPHAQGYDVSASLGSVRNQLNTSSLEAVYIACNNCVLQQ